MDSATQIEPPYRAKVPTHGTLSSYIGVPSSSTEMPMLAAGRSDANIKWAQLSKDNRLERLLTEAAG